VGMVVRNNLRLKHILVGLVMVMGRMLVELLK
jgi:hypothetical protein